MLEPAQAKRIATPPPPPPAGPAAKPENMLRRRVLRVGAFLWKWLVGVVFCMSWLTAFMVVGWTYRAMQRSAFKRWWKSTHPNAPSRFRHSEWAREQRQSHWPNWLLGNRERPKGPRGWFGGIVANFRIGFLGLFNTTVLLCIPCGLILAGWHYGWDISFNKIYEQSTVGATLGFSGMFLFVAVMFYLPMAKARQAVSGDWKRFYDWRVNRRLIRRGTGGLAMLALAMLPAFVVVLFIKNTPFLYAYNPEILAQTTEEQFKILESHWFSTGFIVFALYLLLHLFAAHIYAGAMRRCLRRGELGPRDLAPSEFDVLDSLALIDGGPQSAGSPFKSWLLSLPGRCVCGTIVGLSYLAVGVMVLVAQFFMIHPIQGFVNQPLLQSPMVSYIPFHLSGKTMGGVFLEFVLATVIMLLIGIGGRLAKTNQRH